MENVELRENERRKYEEIKYLSEHPGCPKQRIVARLGCSKRHVNRLLARYNQEIAAGRSGMEIFVHGNRGRRPALATSEEVKDEVCQLYLSKYAGANFTHFTEFLEEQEHIDLSVSTVTAILEGKDIYSPRITKAKKKRVKKELRERLKKATSEKEKKEIHNNLVALENAHSRRPRKAYTGELIQMDASSFEWVPGKIWHLHAAIDDATGAIVGLRFDTQETLSGYHHVTHQMLTNYGIPSEILTDNRTVFAYKSKKSSSIDEDTQTQFGYACQHFGITLSTTSVPQAKGRIERLNETLQARLPIELRVAGISDMDAANEFLQGYIKRFNARFALQLGSDKNVFVPPPSDEEKNLYLSVITSRVVDQGHCIRFQKQYYRMMDKDDNQVHYAKGTKAMVIRAFDGNLYCTVNDENVYALEAIPEHEAYSKEFDSPPPEKPKKEKYIPPMSHPWKMASFQAYLRTRSYLSRETIDSL